MIVLFTSNKDGGIVQLTHTMATTLAELNEEVTVFCREDARLSSDKYKIERYSPIKKLYGKSKSVKSLAQNIVLKNPNCVIFVDDAVQSAWVLLSIKKRVRCVLSVHDVLAHSGFRTRFINRIKRFVKMLSIEKAYRIADEVLMFSQTSKNTFENLYPKYKNKTVCMKLGAHLTTTELSKPCEIDNVADYILFFGRIDGYKGVDFLLDVFRSTPEFNDLELIIAGKSVMNFDWLDNGGSANIKIINRFVTDEEMNWLFDRCLFVVLPYKDASQSGVIPIAYHYGKPVLISDIDGLKEYVDIGETGLVYNSKEDFVHKALKMKELANSMSANSLLYSNNQLNWKDNILVLINTLNERKK